MPVEIVPISLTSKRDVEDFIHFAWTVYRNNPYWVPPLKMERRDHLNPKKNPFFEHAELQLFLAKRGGEIVGRISACRNFEYDKRYGPGMGFFGLFESIDDPEVPRALFGAAEAWCKSRGCNKIQGPFSHSINDDCGLLVKGFDSPQYIISTYNPAYYQALVEGCGYAKIKDLFGWRYDITKPLNEPTLQVAEAVHGTPGLVVRSLDTKNVERDVRTILNVFNEAWENNWGYVPFTNAEADKFVKDSQLIMEPSVIKIAEFQGEPVGILLILPNLNEIIKDLNGAEGPVALAKLAYRAKVSKPFTTARLVLLGIRKKFRGGAFSGASLSVLLYVEAHRSGARLGWKEGELGWTLEDNDKINQGITMMGAEQYKTYRIYEKAL